MSVAQPNKNTTVSAEDVDVLKARVRELETLLKFSELRYAKLDYKFRSLLDRIYGAKTDALSPAQKLLFELLDQPAALTTETVEATPERSEAAGESQAKNRKGKGRQRKVPFPENLPEKREVIDLPEEHKQGLVKIREEITRQIDFNPGSFFWRVIVRPVYASPARECPPRVMPLPPQVIPGSNLATGFIAQVVTARFADQTPYYRQEGIDARSGVVISRQTRQRCAEHVAHLLITIRAQIKQRILDSGYAQVDETFTKVLDPDRRGRSRDAYLWGYLAPREKAFVLEFSLSRSGQILHGFFDLHWSGSIQADGARMYPAAFKHRPEVTLFGCLSHMRRKVVAALKVGESRLAPVYRDIRELFRLEARATELQFTDEQRGHLRHVRSKPILKRIQKSLWDIREEEIDKGTLFGKLKEAVDYAYHQWRRIALYGKLGNGAIQIDTNSIENCFRPGKILLKNALFIAHPAAGWITAVLGTVFVTCKLVGVNPYDYLVWVLPQLAAGTNKTTASGLLPHDFAAVIKAKNTKADQNL
jgi:transposase